MKERKSQIRRQARRARRELAPNLRRWKDEHIARRVLGCQNLKNAKTLCLYWSLTEEVSTREIVRQCLARGQQVALPCHSTEQALRLVLDPEKDLAPAGSSGIAEPGTHCPTIEPESIDCFVLPGVAFDIYGYRVGFGGGYFDRTLSRRNPDARVCALAYECQMFREVPSDPAHDVPVHSIFTEDTIYHFHPSQCVAADAEETGAVARSLARQVAGKFSLGLLGPLGVGKTTFIRAFLDELGVRQPVTSPSFVLMSEYQGRLPARHIDLYRLGDSQSGQGAPSEEDLQMFLETLSEFPGVVLIEWADFAQDWLPLVTPQLRLDFQGSDQGADKRRMVLETYRLEDRPLGESIP